MNKQEVLAALKELKKPESKKNFSQKVDLIFNLKDLDIKKADEQVDFFMSLPHATGKKVKVCALVGMEMKDEAQKECDHMILATEFEKFQKDKKSTKKLAGDYDVFVAQANIMPQVAQSFGRVFGPKKKMPNPKGGMIFPPKASLGPVVARMQKQIRLAAKTSLTMQLMVGNETMSDEDLAENVVAVYTQLVHHLPKERNNIKNAFIKLTMSKPMSLKI